MIQPDARHGRLRLPVLPLFVLMALWLCTAFALSLPAPGWAQALDSAPAIAGAPGAHTGPLPPATTYDPARVRLHLQAFHGFSREQLDAASTAVPQILMGWIDDPEAPVFIKNRSIKALRLYPTDEVFSFVAARLESASAFQILFLLDLQSFTSTHPADIEGLLPPHLNSSDVVVRHAAVELAGRLPASPEISRMLQERLARERNFAVRRAIKRKLDKE